MASDWSKAHASATKRFFNSDAGKALVQKIKDNHPKTKEAVTSEHAALIGSRREGREDVLDECEALQEFVETESDDGEAQTEL